MTETNVGILSIGVYLPDEVRTNDWWPEHVVTRWREKYAQLLPEEKRIQPETEGERLVLDAVAEAQKDPFCGARERRIAPDAMLSSDMEVAACDDALERAGIGREQIDLLLTFSVVPDYLDPPNACAVHHKLGLNRTCLATGIQGACNSFLFQVTLAEQMVRSGRARYALLAQSSRAPKLIDPAAPASAWFGEAATAVLLGPVAGDRGIIGIAHETDGRLFDAIVTSVPGKRWYEDGENVWHARDRRQSPKILMQALDVGRRIVPAGLQDAGIAEDAVDVFACNQPTFWLSGLAKEYIGLRNARAIETFTWAGNLSAANIPLGIATAEREGWLVDGSTIATYGAGLGLTASSVIFRWAR